LPTPRVNPSKKENKTGYRETNREQRIDQEFLSPVSQIKKISIKKQRSHQVQNKRRRYPKRGICHQKTRVHGLGIVAKIIRKIEKMYPVQM